MSHAIRLHAHGGPEQFKYEEVELRAPGPGEARIRHTAIGLNFIDVYQRTGLYQVQLPAILGSEAAGVVEAVADGVEDVKPGDRVAYVLLGAYATHRNVPAARLVKLPDAIADDVAAASMLKGMTTEALLRRVFEVKAEHRVLIHAAAGGVGQLACQWAKSLGATVIGTVGTEAKAEVAKQAGCDHVIVLGQQHLADQVRELTAGKLVNVVYDSVGKDTFTESLECLQRRGTMVSFGQSSGVVPPFDILSIGGPRSLYLTRPSLFAYTVTKDELTASASALFDVIARKAVTVNIGQRFALTDVADAHRKMEGRQTTGSTVLLP